MCINDKNLQISQLEHSPCLKFKDEFIIGIKLVFNSTYFSFNERTYKQIFGTPIGSPLSPIN